jgi:hypothetical protein
VGRVSSFHVINEHEINEIGASSLVQFFLDSSLTQRTFMTVNFVLYSRSMAEVHGFGPYSLPRSSFWTVKIQDFADVPLQLRSDAKKVNY